ncbi:hypothetical protein [Desulfurivibrio alkaliphilus]|uniref:Uncharacterized protein n=1 Tax=Desulfurivibrio alkaliphilus (strain DSM 19089 / UNIQEM U267 / AHT2) TaxID=589865 RepID=D6Z6W4_DESAT|nr:hypothetical protein [Desulfurivibrio alkaliphilus]ADH86951.1 conserved hypothetical protein [Desulfurivibrio alkaliphilus AHT 2]
MKVVRPLLALSLLACYLLAFGLQQRGLDAATVELRHPLPPAVQQIGLGYLKQLGGEVQFVRAAVFHGGVDPKRDPLEYAAPLAATLGAAVRLHPHFIDSYYLAQATLPLLNDHYAREANELHRQGMEALPQRFELPFFAGFNSFYYLQDHVAAASYLQEAAGRPRAPAWFGHLAATLSGAGGDLYGGLLLLEAMLAGEEDELMQERYRHSITMFQRAIMVQEAIEAYRARHGREPADLAELVPADLAELPEFEPPFRLDWEPPELRLLRN